MGAPEVRVRRRDTDYEAVLGGGVAGHLLFRRRGGLLVLVHTEVDPAFEGRGIGGALARFALDDARAQGLLVRPECPFVRAWLAKHPGYEDLLDPSWAPPAD